MTGRRWPVLLLARELGIGGSERQLAVTAASLDRSRFEPHVGCFHEGFRAEELRTAGVSVIRFPVTSFKSGSAFRGARMMGRYLRQHNIQLVHTFDTPLNVFGVPVARAYRTPVVLSSQRAHRELSGGFRRLLRITDAMAQGIVVNCDSVRRQLVEEENVPADRIRVCYNGIDTSKFTPAGRPPSQTPLTVGVVCALRPEKGLATLVEAFAVARNANPHIRLQFVGSGPLLPDIQTLAGARGIAEYCAFEPTTSNVAEWMRRIDVFVLPSLSEALSNALMEAMACGCAVIASDVGGNPELVEHGRTGLLFHPGDVDELAKHLLTMTTNRPLREEMGAHAAAVIRDRFTLATCATRMEEIYTEYLAGRAIGQGAS
jgi:glycosyltransferase involved in cell wall biosynthesis